MEPPPARIAPTVVRRTRLFRTERQSSWKGTLGAEKTDQEPSRVSRSASSAVPPMPPRTTTVAFSHVAASLGPGSGGLSLTGPGGRHSKTCSAPASPRSRASSRARRRQRSAKPSPCPRRGTPGRATPASRSLLPSRRRQPARELSPVVGNRFADDLQVANDRVLPHRRRTNDGFAHYCVGLDAPDRLEDVSKVEG